MKKKYWGGILVLILLCPLSIWILAQINSNMPAVIAHQGVAYVDDSVMSQGLSMLGGQWEQFNGVQDPQELESFQPFYGKPLQYAGRLADTTLRISITIDTKEPLYLLFPLPDGMDLYLNGVEMYPEGITTQDMIPLPNGQTELILSYEEGNNYPRWDFHGPLIGTGAQLERLIRIWMAMDLFAIGFYLCLLIHVIVLYLQKRSEKYLLSISAMTICLLIHNFFSSRFSSLSYIFNLDISRPIISYLFLPLERLLYFETCCQLIPNILSRKAHKSIRFLLTGYIFFYVAAQIFVSFKFLGVVTEALSMMIFGAQGWLLFQGFGNKVRGAGTILTGYILYFSISIIFFQGIRYGILPFGSADIFAHPRQYSVMIYLLTISIVIHDLFALKFKEAEELTVTLKQFNNNLETMVDEKTQEIQTSNEKLTIAYQKLTDMDKKKVILLANVFHNLRSPISVLIGFLDMMEAALKKDADKAAEFIPRMRQKCEYLGRLSEELFLISRLEDDKVDFNKKSEDLSIVVGQTINSFRNAIDNMKINLTYTSKPAFCHIDVFRMQQVVENLLDNAVRYCNHGGDITISVSQPGQHVIFSIANTGKGINEEEQKHIFERYYMNRIANQNQGSTGLGLYLSNEIVLRHQGALTVKSVPNELTTFTVTLPAINSQAYLSEKHIIPPSSCMH
ncbi:sensor protein SrrB [Oxobacter pfennigii]|uniref:histidine kinase n=1 Tax=Oxobacter pfennigii TaxID=36849 RepID=A0A0P8X0P8_9CLOT|nr:HAMP domain-containing sensor histidine kinase [Oxobacter pfennigii]KPU44347.1 sensor protein SrrB [Oxobacter pfennigii]